MTDNEDYKETWFIVPRSILDLPAISLGFLKVFETIFQFWNKNRKCFLSNPEISKRTGLKVTQVKEAIAYFERHKELERIQIGMKRYLMQPMKVVEIPGLELVPKKVAATAATCTEDTQVAAVAARGGRSAGQVVAAGAATEIKNLNKEKKRSNTKSVSFPLEKALEQNPHGLSLEILEEWNTIRITKHKSPLTARAWARTNNVLSELISKGLKLDDIIDRMLAAEWRGVEVSYFNSEIAKLNQPALKFPTADERAANEIKIREREMKAAEEKRKEIADSKVAANRITLGKKERDAAYEAKRIEMGMTVSEYSAYVLNQAAKNPNNG